MTSERHILEFRPSGDTGLTVILGGIVDEATSKRVLRVKAALDAAVLPGILETVPSYLSLLVHYDPLVIRQAALKAAISELACLEHDVKDFPVRQWRLPVCFEPEFALDLEYVASWAETSQEEVIRQITSADQLVYMLGFAPGQPYMGDLPEALALPRRKEPIANVPAGSVLIATGKTVIYPTNNPTGWYVVGRTPIRLFDLDAANPALLKAGDRVTLNPISRDAFVRLSERVRDGTYDAEREARS